MQWKQTNRPRVSVGKVLVSVLWLGAGGVAIATGNVIAALVVALYLVYLWVFGGRWLIF